MAQLRAFQESLPATVVPTPLGTDQDRCGRGSQPARFTRVKEQLSIPVICTGGLQTASVIREAIGRGDCDAVSIARPLMANPDLPRMFASGKDTAERPCTYCNRCLINVLEHPLGCYDETRYSSSAAMIRELTSFYQDDSTLPVGRPAARHLAR